MRREERIDLSLLRAKGCADEDRIECRLQRAQFGSPDYVAIHTVRTLDLCLLGKKGEVGGSLRDHEAAGDRELEIGLELAFELLP